MAALSMRAMIEGMANQAGRHLAECKTDTARQSALGLLEKFSANLYLKDRYFSVERFNNRVLQVEEQFRNAMKKGWSSEPLVVEAIFTRTTNGKGPRRISAKSKRTT